MNQPVSGLWIPGRLWQTLILSRWRPLLALVPVESVVHDRQRDYYAAQGSADQRADATCFVEFMLEAILRAIRELPVVTDQVRKLQVALRHATRAAAVLMVELGLVHRPTFRDNYLHPALDAGLVEMTRPDAPRARNQKYRLTATGKRLVARQGAGHGE